MAVRKLNMVMTYPVKWSEREVMSNYIQNFYDALGMDQFHDRFDVSFDNGTITMKSDIGFSKDWLFYIGASTKRDGNRKYAGKFGEGFKIAALVSIRDMNMGVCMESRDWKLSVTEADDIIDGNPVKVLAYDIVDRPYEENSILTLTGATKVHYDQLFHQINRFYYEENQYFKSCISKGPEHALYTAHRNPNEKRLWGGLFLNLEHRATLRIPIFFCLHNYPVKWDDRERGSLKKSVVISAIRKVIEYLSPMEALQVLELFNSRWFDCGGERMIYDYDWHKVISDLIGAIASDKTALLTFQKKYSSLLVAESHWSWYSSHKKAMAHEWFRYSEYSERRRVCSLFIKLGIKDMYTLCSENGGFEEEALPNDSQKRRIEILQSVALKVFGEIICYDRLPDCHLISNAKSPLAGKAKGYKETRSLYNNMGLRVVSDIHTVFILSRYLCDDKMHEALSVYMHELLHQFGGDSSVQFRRALIRMNEIIVENRKEILEFEPKWREVS